MTQQQEIRSPITGIKRVPVRSSNIAEVGHDVVTGVIEIKFLNGSVWQYPGKFGRDVYEGLVNADSVGSFFRKHVYSRVNPQRHINVSQDESATVEALGLGKK